MGVGSGVPCVADTMAEICGDGLNLKTFANECDDRNLINGDGCSSVCLIEAGWNCGYGSSNNPDFCWPLNRPLIIDAAISSDNNILYINCLYFIFRFIDMLH